MRFINLFHFVPSRRVAVSRRTRGGFAPGAERTAYKERERGWALCALVYGVSPLVASID